MTLFETILFAVSLGVDCFTVSIASGIILKRYNWPIFIKGIFLWIISGYHAPYRLVGCFSVCLTYTRL